MVVPTTYTMSLLVAATATREATALVTLEVLPEEAMVAVAAATMLTSEALGVEETVDYKQGTTATREGTGSMGESSGGNGTQTNTPPRTSQTQKKPAPKPRH